MLFHYQENFGIYAMTWDDIFLTFEHKEDFILKELKFDKQVILDEIEAYTNIKSGLRCIDSK